ncbi:hypothetical protein D9758_010101 [Tetrapyrgos nigripes]|uniref:C2H2-type domain-containing protein n=1 Tax=Tetrapyrgos nigripes TaxID=182062 RepID=A0A8H5CS17_9AGAR|nr:hypothetical protein D9758_010101 [Tetrapyrgos nigripes]
MPLFFKRKSPRTQSTPPAPPVKIRTFDNIKNVALHGNQLRTVGRDLHEVNNYYCAGPDHCRHIPNCALQDPGSGFRQGSVRSNEQSPLVSRWNPGKIRVVTLSEIELVDELHRRKHYRVHSGKLDHRSIVVKVFQGRKAQETFRRTVAINELILHPNVLRMKAISSALCQVPFIVYDSACEKGCVEYQIMSALSESADRSIRLGFQIVGDLSAGLDYLLTSGMPIRDIREEVLEIYITEDDRVKIGVNDFELQGASHENYELNLDDEDILWDVFNRLCEKTFKKGNRILYEAEVQFPNALKMDPTVKEDAASPSGSSTSSNLPFAPTESAVAPCRELVWITSSRGSTTLDSVARQYTNRLHIHHLNETSLLSRRFQVTRKSFQVRHRCQGYSKEEITLTCSIKNNAIVAHTIPSPGEMCPVCGSVVEEEGTFRSKLLYKMMGSPQAFNAHGALYGSTRPVKNGKKRGQVYKCESCSKIYRHPSCLIKHRWEHTPRWRESSKYVLSKHQQVQLLEAAAILSHLTPDSATGTSLPEDRSLWPSFLSGGALPAPEVTTFSIGVAASYGAAQSQSRSSYAPLHPSSRYVRTSSLLGSKSTSSIAPSAASDRAPSAGPRFHDYTVTGGQNVTVTQA